MDIEAAELSSEDVDQLIEACAQRVIDLRLAVPAIFFLELHKPLVTIAYSGGVFAMPLLAPVLGAERYKKMMEILKDRSNVEQLIDQIEQLELRRRSQPDGGR